MKKFLQRDTIYTIKSRYRSLYETEKYPHVVENHVVEIHISQGIAVICFWVTKELPEENNLQNDDAIVRVHFFPTQILQYMFEKVKGEE